MHAPGVSGLHHAAGSRAGEEERVRDLRGQHAPERGGRRDVAGEVVMTLYLAALVGFACGVLCMAVVAGREG